MWHLTLGNSHLVHLNMPKWRKRRGYNPFMYLCYEARIPPPKSNKPHGDGSNLLYSLTYHPTTRLNHHFLTHSALHPLHALHAPNPLSTHSANRSAKKINLISLSRWHIWLNKPLPKGAGTTSSTMATRSSNVQMNKIHPNERSLINEARD